MTMTAISNPPLLSIDEKCIRAYEDFIAIHFNQLYEWTFIEDLGDCTVTDSQVLSPDELPVLILYVAKPDDKRKTGKQSLCVIPLQNDFYAEASDKFGRCITALKALGNIEPDTLAKHGLIGGVDKIIADALWHTRWEAFDRM